MMGASQTSPSLIVWSVEVSAEGVYRDTVLKLALRLSLAEDKREKPRRWQRLLRGVQSSSEKFPVPWTKMSWLKLARLRCCSPLRKTSCDFRRCHAQMLDTSLLQLASRVTSAMHAESSNGDHPFAKVKSLVSEMIARLEEEASAVAHKAYCDRDAGCC